MEPEINAYVAFLDSYAKETAAAREAEVRHGRLRGGLHGVPIAVKDNFYLTGFAVKKGSRTSTDKPASYDSPMVERIVSSGAVIIGKTTMPEMGWKGTGSSPLTGFTRNPYDPAKNSGGSSAGSAATVAARAVPIALGSDAGGSIRIPASFCGTVGFKPTLGKIPVYPGTVTETLSHVGPLCRSAEDAALVLSATAGPDPRDPYSFAARGNGESVRMARLHAGALRVGLLPDPFAVRPDPGVADAFGHAVDILKGAIKADVRTVTFDAALPRAIFEAFWVTGRGYGFVDIVKSSADIMDPGLVRCYTLAQDYTLPEFFQAIEARRKFVANAFALCEEVDVLVTPTMPLTAFAAEDEVPPGGEADAPLPWVTWTPYTYPFNISGQPAISIPCGMADGLPVGLQIVSAWGCDAVVLAFAKLCEDALRNGAAALPLPAMVSELLAARR